MKIFFYLEWNCRHETRNVAGALADLDTHRFGPPGPNSLADLDARSKSASEYGPLGTKSASGFGSPSRIWTPYVIVKTHTVIHIQSTEMISLFNVGEETFSLAFKILQTYS